MNYLSDLQEIERLFGNNPEREQACLDFIWARFGVMSFIDLPEDIRKRAIANPKGFITRVKEFKNGNPK